MKAIIFSGTAKNKENSDSKVWCEHLKLKLSQNKIESEIIYLKDFDYEATVNGDNLLPELRKMYDAQIIIFAGPIIHGVVAFPLYNLWRRFRHAYEKGMEAGVNIFDNKYFELCLLFGSCLDYTDSTKSKDKKVRITYYARHHDIVYEKLNFMNPVGHNLLSVCLSSPMDPSDLTRKTLSTDEKTNADIDKLITMSKQVCVNDQSPECSVDEFTEFFRDTDGRFGRRMTLSKDNLNEKNVIENIKFIRNNNDLELQTKLQIILCMKERADRAGEHDLAVLYFAEMHRLIEDEGARTISAGLHRPSNY